MTFNVAIIGTGSFAQQHILALQQVPEARVTHVAGSSLSRARALAMLAPEAQASDDIDAVLGDPSVDAVDICNATPDHARWAIAAGRVGKHVHVDKPATLSIRSFDEMVEAVEGNGLTLMVGQTARFQPAMVEIQHACATGSIGTPRLLHVSWLTGHVWPNGWRAWQFDVAKSGGHPVHNGIHTIDLAVWLMRSRPVEVFARHFPSFAAEMPMPDSFQVQLRFDNGSLAAGNHPAPHHAGRNRGDPRPRLHR
jgi:predicted dehydrogenase